MEGAGFLRRLVAYFLDIIPITLVVALVFYLAFGFDDTLRKYLAQRPPEPTARQVFLQERNLIRNVALGVYLLYCSLLEASAMRATIGKQLVGIVVANADGSRLTLAQCMKRNAGKPLSFLICGLGCLWITWSVTKQAWHDMLARSFVVVRSSLPIATRDE